MGFLIGVPRRACSDDVAKNLPTLHCLKRVDELIVPTELSNIASISLCNTVVTQRCTQNMSPFALARRLMTGARLDHPTEVSDKTRMHRCLIELATIPNQKFECTLVKRRQ
jgi:hypothetical protein